MNLIRNASRIAILTLMAAGALLVGSATQAAAGEPGHGRPGSHGGPHYDSPRGGVSIWYRPAPSPVVTRGVTIRAIPAPAPTIVVPAPEILTCTDGSLIQRTYYVVNGVLTYQDTLVQSAPVIVQPVQSATAFVTPVPATVVVQPAPVVFNPAPQPTWVNILRGIGVSIRW